jgi:REP element-mobilizing transposase RayT
MSEMYQSLFHSRWNCIYQVVFIPKCRRKMLYGEIRKQLGGIFHELARQKECQIIEGHLVHDHVHMCIKIADFRSLITLVNSTHIFQILAGFSLALALVSSRYYQY